MPARVTDSEAVTKEVTRHAEHTDAMVMRLHPSGVESAFLWPPPDVQLTPRRWRFSEIIRHVAVVLLGAGARPLVRRRISGSWGLFDVRSAATPSPIDGSIAEAAPSCLTPPGRPSEAQLPRSSATLSGLRIPRQVEAPSEDAAICGPGRSRSERWLQTGSRGRAEMPALAGTEAASPSTTRWRFTDAGPRGCGDRASDGPPEPAASFVTGRLDRYTFSAEQ